MFDFHSPTAKEPQAMRTNCTHYTVESIFEEGDCTFCGEPIMYGDRATEANGRVYCGRKCAEADHEAHPEWDTHTDAAYNKIVDLRDAAAQARAQQTAGHILTTDERAAKHGEELRTFSRQAEARAAAGQLSPLPQVITITREEMPELFAQLDPAPVEVQTSFGQLADNALARRTLPGGQIAF